MPLRSYDNWTKPPTGSRGYSSANVAGVDVFRVAADPTSAVIVFSGLDHTATITDTPERLADMLRFALEYITSMLPADTPPPAEPVDETDIDTVSEADWADVLTDRFGGEAA
jgi:hypothetical protein